MRPTFDPAGAGAPASPRAIRTVGMALFLGAGSFAIAAAVLPLLGVGSDPTAPGTGGEGGAVPDEGFLLTLSMVHAVLFASALVITTVIRVRIAGDPEGRAQHWVIRWAILEGAALFGIVIVLLAGLQGAVPENPVWYLNYASFLAFAVSIALDLVTGAGSDERQVQGSRT